MSGYTDKNRINSNTTTQKEQNINQSLEPFYQTEFKNLINKNYQEYLNLLKQLKEKETECETIFQNIPKNLLSTNIFNPQKEAIIKETENFKNITIPFHTLKMVTTLKSFQQNCDLYYKAQITFYFEQALGEFLLTKNLSSQEKEQRKNYLNLFIKTLKEMNPKDDFSWLKNLETLLDHSVPVQPKKITLHEKIFEALELNLKDENFRIGLLCYINDFITNPQKLKNINWEDPQNFIDGANQWAKLNPMDRIQLSEEKINTTIKTPPPVEKFKEILENFYKYSQNMKQQKNDLKTEAAKISVDLTRTDIPGDQIKPMFQRNKI